MASLRSIDPTATAVNLSPAQIRFLILHVKRVVYRWQWHFCDTMLRAHSGKRVATIWADELSELEALGLIEAGLGVSMGATAAGRAFVKELEEAK